ncbi:hypothetical protein [Serratia proteamaculans]
MSITIFRKMRGRVVPITVDEEHAAEYLSHEYIKTPKHKVTTSKFDSVTSFTIPNASCQKCGKDVFYYENSYGSRVLFDFLGPPWPIHPCYNSESVLKNKTPPAVMPGWEPVLIEKGIITSSGGLRIQGSTQCDKIRFTFEETDFSKMRIDINDVTNLIIFSCREKGKVQTHNGKRTFTCRYELVSEKGDDDVNNQEKITTPSLTIETSPSATETPITPVITPHIVGTLAIRDIELVVDEKEKMTVIVNGNLNKRFRVSYILLEHDKINDLLSELENEIKDTHLKTCLVKDSEDEITLVFPNQKGDAEKVFNVSFVKKKQADSLTRIKPTHDEKPAPQPRVLHRKKRERSLEEHIGSLATKISSSMADAFLNAKKN